MKLKFIWIQEYKNIHQTGFNFNYGGQEVFEFREGELLISKKNHEPKGFFKSNIIGVTAIVGKNGSGKTNLTEFINYNLAHATNGVHSTYGVGRGILVIDKWILAQRDIEIKNSDKLKRLGYRILPFDNAPLDKGQGELRWHKMEENKYIYYNPTFDLRGVDVDDNLVNISTTMLVYNDRWNSQKLYPYVIREGEKINQLHAFEAMEKERICDFLLDFDDPKNYIDFLPKALLLKVDNENINHFLQKKYYSGEELQDLKNVSYNVLRERLNSLESFMLHYYDFEQYFKLQPENSATRYYNIPIEEQKMFFFNLFFIKVFWGLLNRGIRFPEDYARRFLYEPENLQELPWLHHTELIALREAVLEVLERANWIIFDLPLSEEKYAKPDEKVKSIYRYLGTLEYSLEGENKEVLKNALSLMDRLMGGKRVFSYEPLGGLSSGQQHLLSLFARFFWAKKRIADREADINGINGRNIVVFIDEGEVALHPEWQRVFFQKVISYLSKLFNGRTIQLLITTHSPFVLSDIPKDNVIFLERDAMGLCKVSQINRNNTFGANIYALLADSFFMQNTIGAFANEKMQWALDILRSGHTDYSIETIEELRYVVTAIGEPIIQQQFEMLYKTKYGHDEIGDLQRRIKELENQLKEQRDDTTEN